MMRKLVPIGLLGVFICVLSSQAYSSVLVTGSIEGRIEQGMDQNVGAQSYFDVSGEYGWQQFYFGGEYFQGQPSTTGQSTLSTTRIRQGGWLTAAWQAPAWGPVIPYIRGGLGGYQDSVTTTFYGTNSTDVSGFYVTGFGGGGLRLWTNNIFFLSIEGRLIFGENYYPQPSEAMLLRFGLDL